MSLWIAFVKRQNHFENPEELQKQFSVLRKILSSPQVIADAAKQMLAISEHHPFCFQNRSRKYDKAIEKMLKHSLRH